MLVTNDSDAEGLTFELRSAGYVAVASVEHKTRQRLATVRLMSPSGVIVDLLFASSGIESEIVEAATAVDFEGTLRIPVASAEGLLAMKILSMTDRRLQDRIDAQHLLEFTPGLDLSKVRENLAKIKSRGYSREQDLEAKLASVLRELGRSD